MKDILLVTKKKSQDDGFYQPEISSFRNVDASLSNLGIRILIGHNIYNCNII